MSLSKIIQQAFVFLAIVTSMGTLVHDTKINKAYALAVPMSEFSVNVASHLDSLRDSASHTHVESISLKSAFASAPRINVRDDHKRYILPKYSSRSDDALGGGMILWPSV